ncbi:nucleoporin NUP56 [Penicillium sp. IBT 18751x]|nr:nucleoporin NUP56 [Penicillium sp. IBT 18751x]
MNMENEFLTNMVNEKISQFQDSPATKQTPTSTTTATMLSDEHSTQVLKKKRSREQLDMNSAAAESAHRSTQVEPSEEKSTDAKEPEKKRHRDGSQEQETKPDKGFAGSAFATSSLAAFAGSDKSPFGSIGASTPSVFKPADSGLSSFASPSGGSGFGSFGGGFSGVGGGFSAAAKTGGLTSFASPSAPATFGETKPSALGESKASTLGAEDSKVEDSESDKDDAEEEDKSTFEAEKTDERFYEQTMETGEEEEITYFSSKSKLFRFLDGEWKERGIGTFKLNGRKSSTDPEKIFSRMIMRADGNMRVMLNSSLFRGMNYGDSKNECPTTKQILVAGLENGRTFPLMLRFSSVETAEKLWTEIGKCIKNLPGDEEEEH